MLTPDDFIRLTETLHPILDRLNEYIIRSMIRRMMARLGRGEGVFFTATDRWQAEVLQMLGGHLQDVRQAVKDFTRASDQEISEIFKDAGIQSWGADADVMGTPKQPPATLKERLNELASSFFRRTRGHLYNLTRTTADKSTRGFAQALDRAHVKVTSGATSYTQAVREAVDEITEAEAEVVYPTGHVDTVETATLRAVRTGTAQASGDMALASMEEMGWDLIRVSSHLGARYGDGGENPGNHFWWQGKLYSRTGRDPKYPPFSLTGYGTGEGLCGWNCRHSFGPGDPNFNPWKNYDSEENKKAYDISQRQRTLEREIRHQKLKVLGMKEARDAAEDPELKAGLQEDYGRAALDLQKKNKDYNRFCEENGLKRFDDRLAIARWNRSEAAQATRAAAKVEAAASTQAEAVLADTLRQEGRGSADYPETFEDMEPLELSELTREKLADLRERAKKSGWEWGITQTGADHGEAYTDKKEGVVAAIWNSAVENNLWHAHTNGTPLSSQDLSLMTQKGVESTGVVLYNGVVFQVSLGYGIKPTEKEFWEAARMIEGDVNEEYSSYAYDGLLSGDEANYQKIREKMIRISRYFEWTVKGGRL